MKKVFMLGAMVCALGMMAVSCSKDNEELIVGKWRIHSTEGYAVEQTVGDVGDAFPEDTVIYEDHWGWLFNADGTGYSYEITNGTEKVMTDLTYSVDGDSLHIAYSNCLRLDLGIDKLTSRKLRLAWRAMISDIDGNAMGYVSFYWNLKKM